jgi:hypothetical protein
MPMHSMIRTLSLLAALAPAGHAAEAPTIAAGGVVLWATADGTLHASGDAESGRGDADGTPRRHFAPVAGVRDVVAVAVQRDGDDGAAALDRRGTVWVWGRVFCPFAATREACAADDRAPRAVPGLSDIVAIAAGSEHLLALDRAGRVIAIGDNQYGQLGTGDTEWRRTATAIDGIDEVVAIAAGTQNSYFVRRDGSIWGAGLGWGGMLGPTARSGGLFDGLDEKSVNAQPLRIAGPEDIVAISAGNNFVVARDRDGRVWGWGGNDSAQLGQPASDLGIVAPRRLRGFEAVVDVAAGYDFVVAATEAGTILAQGGNVYGALGDGRGELDGALRTIEGIDDARRVFAGHYNAFALRADGSMLGWGANDPEVGGFTLRHDEGRAPPTPLDAVERPAAPSDIVRAGGVSLPIRAELGGDQRSERVRVAIDGREPIVLAVDGDNATATARIDLPIGSHPYTLDGEAVMADGSTLRIEGRGVIVVGPEPMAARFAALAASRGMAAAFDATAAAVGTTIAAKADVVATGPIPATALDALQAAASAPMPRALREALQALGPFELRFSGSPFPSVALHAPERQQSLAQWLADARATVRDPPRDPVEDDLAFHLHALAAELEANTEAPWMADRVAATLPDSTLYLVAHAGRCDDGAARGRLAAIFDPDIDEESGEERYFAWADTSECDLDLTALLRSTAGDAVIQHYRTHGAVCVAATDPDSLYSGLLRDADPEPGVLRLRLAQ